MNYSVITRHCKSFNDVITKGLPLINALILVIAEFATLKLKIYRDFPVFIIILNGIVFGFMATKQILATMTKVNLQITFLV